MSATNKLLYGAVGLGAAYLLTRHEGKIQEAESDLTFVNTRLDEYGNAIEDVKADVDYITDRYGQDEGTISDMAKECCPIDATLKVGDLLIREEDADYRLFMQFQNLNKYHDIKISVKQIIIRIESFSKTIGDGENTVYSVVVPKNTKETNWYLVSEAVNGKWFGHSTIGKLMYDRYGYYRNNRRGHFYPAQIDVYYQITNPTVDKLAFFGGWAHIQCEWMEELYLTWSKDEPLTNPSGSYKQPYPSPSTLYSSNITNAQLIKDYRNESLWNPAFAYGNWFRPDVDGSDYRYPHHNNIHPDYKDHNVTYEYDEYNLA